VCDGRDKNFILVCQRDGENYLTTANGERDWEREDNHRTESTDSASAREPRSSIRESRLARARIPTAPDDRRFPATRSFFDTEERRTAPARRGRRKLTETWNRNILVSSGGEEGRNK